MHYTKGCPKNRNYWHWRLPRIPEFIFYPPRRPRKVSIVFSSSRNIIFNFSPKWNLEKSENTALPIRSPSKCSCKGNIMVKGPQRSLERHKEGWRSRWIIEIDFNESCQTNCNYWFWTCQYSAIYFARVHRQKRDGWYLMKPGEGALSGIIKSYLDQWYIN